MSDDDLLAALLALNFERAREAQILSPSRWGRDSHVDASRKARWNGRCARFAVGWSTVRRS